MNLLTVNGLVSVDDVRWADGHAYAWIKSPKGEVPQSRLELDYYAAILAELTDFHAAVATALVDCQPGGCGRDGNLLRKLVQATELQITAMTGFHQRNFCTATSALWSTSALTAAASFIKEFTIWYVREGGTGRATTIWEGYQGTISGWNQTLMEAAAVACIKTVAAIRFHTEQESKVEALMPLFADCGGGANSVYIFHVDKRPN